MSANQVAARESTHAHRRRVLILDVQPSVDAGRYAAKRVVGDSVTVTCDLISDGHDAVQGVVRHQTPGAPSWTELPLSAQGNDRFAASLSLGELGSWRFEIEAWIDEFSTWQHGITRKIDTGQDVTFELQSGILLVEQARSRSEGDTASRLGKAVRTLRDGETEQRLAFATSATLAALMRGVPDRSFSTRSERFELVVDPERARFSAWYELFPRSFGKDGKHGTFDDVRALLPYVASMGFDVLYFPPIHPIGRSFRKGPNNTLESSESDPGSPWAIGAAEGGHKEIHPELGTVEDFEKLVAEARQHGIEIALDIAFQASPDHPYVSGHPEWFIQRPDGSIQYAENPPKKYQDVYPFDLSGPQSQSLWDELRSVFEVWVERGIRVFRVDNPHTKPIPFWEYCIGTLKQSYPEIIFLAEAFTRPKLMYALAKAGFSQSYTYFTWRTGSHELRAYMEELTKTNVSDFLRPNFWPNTPDILPEHLQFGGRGMFVSRMVLAATLSSNWGIYGPAFELMEHQARPGSEEYIDNEKYQLRSWDLEAPHSLSPAIARVNSIRRENRALQRNDTLVFHGSSNDNVLVYSKTDAPSKNTILVVVNLEPQHRHSAWLTLDLERLNLDEHTVFQAHDLMSDARYQWRGREAYVELDPEMPAHVIRIRRRERSEHNFEYFI